MLAAFRLPRHADVISPLILRYAEFRRRQRCRLPYFADDLPPILMLSPCHFRRCHAITLAPFSR